MKRKSTMRKLAFAMLGSFITLLMINIFQYTTEKEYKGNIYIPYSMAEENILITSAGQSTDTYIVKNIVNDMMLHNFFMPKADKVDLESIKSAVIVVGHSIVGESLNDGTFTNEFNRITRLIKDAEQKKVPIIMVYIGGRDRRSTKTNELIKLVAPKSSFIVSTHEGNYDGLLEQISKEYDVPLSLVQDIQEIKEPLAALYR